MNDGDDKDTFEHCDVNYDNSSDSIEYDGDDDGDDDDDDDDGDDDDDDDDDDD